MAENDKEVSKNPEPQAKGQANKPVSAVQSVLAVLIALLIVAVVFCGVFYFILKNNIYGLGEAYRSVLKDHPILKLALPPLPPKEDPDDPKNLTDDEVREKYVEYRKKVADLNKKLDEAHVKIAQLEKDSNTLSENQKVLEENKKLLASMEEQKKKLDEDMKKLGEIVANGDKEGFKAYFAQIDKQTAEAIYKDLIQADLNLDIKTTIAKPFAVMEPASAAKVLSELWAKDKESLINIMEGLKPQAAALILEKMDATLAAEVTRILTDRKLGR